ncbi:MAG: PH domain-containing protein [Candidatus Promineifilaceae bacterium]
MSFTESHGHIKAQIWKAIAKSELDLSAVPESELESLVELVTDAALIEIDNELGKSSTMEAMPEPGNYIDSQGDKELVLWSGRPFLSIVTEFIITNERIRIISGLLGKDREDIELIRVQDIDQKQTLSDRILQIGDIVILSHDSSDPTAILHNVKDPEKVHELLRRAILDARKRHGLIYREEM